MPLWIRADKGKERSDRELLDLYYESGDLDLLGVLYSRYMHLVYGVCLKYLANRDESQDAVMGIFEKLIHELDRHRVENFKSWLYTLTRNYCLMHIRKTNSEINRIREIYESGIQIMENDTDLHPIDREERTDEASLEECIEKLKAEQRECVRLFYYGNKCYREISDVMKIDEKKVKSHLQNAKRNLKICLEEGHGKKE